MKFLRFRLRTLFIVVAVLGIPMGWVAYQLNWIRERHGFVTQKHCATTMVIFSAHTKAPWSLSIFGENPVSALTEVPAEYAEEGRRLFPEAIVNPRPGDFPEPPPMAPSFGPTQR